MFFAHLADCHLGGWRDPVMREVNIRAFETAIGRCVDEKVDFVIISGDLFNTSVPGIDTTRAAFEQLRRLKDAEIGVYFVAGSHDCSPSGRSILDVVESAGLGVNVSRGAATEDGLLRLEAVRDAKTGVALCGIPGRSGGLDRQHYEFLDRAALEKIPAPRIFVFHSSISELKPEGMEHLEAMGVSMLPNGFDYYAGGHVHIIGNRSFPGHLNVVYPGPTYPNNFAELEQLGAGSFCLVRDWQVEHVRIEPHPVASIEVNVDGKSAAEAQRAIATALPEDASGQIVLLRIEGMLSQGSVADIKWAELSGLPCVALLKNTNALTSKEFEEVSIETGTLEEMEERLTREHAGKSGILAADQEIVLTKELMGVLSAEKNDGEKTGDFERRVQLDARGVLDRRIT